MKVVLALAVAAALAPVPAGAQDAAAERLYAEASRLRQAGDSSRAVAELELFLRQFPADRLASRALLDVAELHAAAGDRDSALAAAERLTVAYPRTAEAASGFLLQGEGQMARASSAAELEAARTTLRRIPLLYGADAFPRLEARQIARVRSAEAGLRLADFEGSAAELLAAIEEEPLGPWTGRARLAFARGLLLGSGWVPAIESLQRVAGADVAPGPRAAAFAVDRSRARRLLGLLHRRFLRGLAGQPQWAATVRWPKAGLTLEEPVGVAADLDGNVLLIDKELPLLAVLDPDGTVGARRAIEDLGGPGFTPDGRPFAVGEGRILLLASGEHIPLADPRPNKSGPLKGAFAAARGLYGDWLVLSKSFDGVLVYDAAARPLGTILGDEKVELQDVAVDDLGRFYVLDARANQVTRLGPDRRSQGVVARGTWDKPVAVAVDLLGDVYVLDRGEARIDVFDANGRKIAVLGPQLGGGVELRNPTDLAVDGAGRVYVTDPKLPFLAVVE